MVKSKKNLINSKAKSTRSTKTIKVKAAKLSRKPLAQDMKQSAPKKDIKKNVVKSKTPSPKTISRSAKKVEPKTTSKKPPSNRILTAEGWKRIMMRDQKHSKVK